MKPGLLLQACGTRFVQEATLVRIVRLVSHLALFAAAAMHASAQPGGIAAQTAASDQPRSELADPAVPRPPVHPCEVDLFANLSFQPHGNPVAMNAEPNQWSFEPPAQCPGPWSKVVLEADFSVTAGRQYDRTASIWLDGVNLYFGTTMEPSAHRAPQWHAERDLTQYASLFRKPGKGQVILNNWVDHTYTGVIRGAARLLFYPAVESSQPPAAADVIYGLDSDPRGVPVSVESESDVLSRTLSLPRNVERIYLDVIAQSQATDEQWYMCVDDADLNPTRDYSLGPPASGDPLEQCGNGNFREVEVTIDGQPAGRAPVYPWTYTGGVDPYLWRPTPDVQTLNFAPYQIDLTPFAALLDDGHSHAIAMRVIAAHHFFSLAANLLIYQDHGRQVLTGRLLENTLAGNRAQLVPHVDKKWKTQSDGIGRGRVDTFQHGLYSIVGELNTSRGRVLTRVEHQSTYTNRQSFLHPDATTYRQIITMDVQALETTSTSNGNRHRKLVRRMHYPLFLDVIKHMKPDGSFTAVIAMRQAYVKRLEDSRTGAAPFWSRLNDSIDTHDTADFNAAGTAILNSRDQYGHQLFEFSDSLGSCYARLVESRGGEVASTASAAGCKSGANSLNWHSSPQAIY